VLGTSQPTISRLINRLEKQGVIKEYTMIPDFSKLGYTLMVVTLVKHREDLDPEHMKIAERKGVSHARTESSLETVMAERGIGFGYDAVIIAYEKDYTAYKHLLERIKAFNHLEASQTQSFIVDLSDKVHYRPFTYSTIAKHFLPTRKPEKE
jgi:DNA-binding Lrp family transcriptional regulator